MYEEPEEVMSPLNGGWVIPAVLDEVVDPVLDTATPLEEASKPLETEEVVDPVFTPPEVVSEAPPVATHSIEHRSFGHGMRVTTITGQNN